MRSTVSAMKMVSLAMCWVCCLQLCSSQVISCTVYQDRGRTVYNVPKSEGTMCQYNWANVTKHVVANQVQTPADVVVSQNSTTLITYDCHEVIYYGRDCISEGTLHEAICTTNCSKSAGMHQIEKDEEGDDIKPVMKTRLHYCLLAVVLLLVVGIPFVVRCRRSGHSPDNDIVADV